MQVAAGFAIRTIMFASVLPLLGLRAQASPSVQASVAGRSPAKRALPIAEYARWRWIIDETMSADGRWVAWTATSALTGRRLDDELHVKSVDSPKEYIVPAGFAPLFSADARWVAYSVRPPMAERERLQREGRAVIVRVEVLELSTGKRTSWDDAATYSFAATSLQLLVKQRRAATDREGRDLIVHRLLDGDQRIIANVNWHALSPSGTLVAFVVDAPDRTANGLSVLTLTTGEVRTLDAAPATYTDATWSAKGSAIAVLRGVDDATRLHRDNTLLAFTGLAGATSRRTALGGQASGMSLGHVISEFKALRWNAGEDRVFFGTKAQEDRLPAVSNGEIRPSDVNVYHWNDDRLQTLQANRATQDRRRTNHAVAHLDAPHVLMLTDSTTELEIGADGLWAIESDERAYISDWKEPAADYYRVNVSTGERRPIVRALVHAFGLSPDGQQFLYWKDGHVWAYALASDRHVNLTATVGVRFTNEAWDYPQTTAPSYGLAGWTKDGTGVVLNHRYDLWYVRFDGGPSRNLTQGRGEEREIRFRVEKAGEDNEWIDLTKPVLVSANGRRTRKAGYFELRGEQFRELVYTDHMYWLRQRAAGADRLLYSRESWTESSDLHVASSTFASATRLTNTNPQQAEYSWGRRLLIDFVTRDSVRLQATLAIPDTWQAGRRLPMVVRFYEKPSQFLHAYPLPRYRGLPFAAYVSNGYLVLEPDVHFRGGSTYSDMLESVEAAVDRVVQLGYADPARVGLFGHSFSGDGAAFIATHSRKFAAIVAGAATANPISAFNAVMPGYGLNGQGWFIRDQGRFGTNPYDDFDAYWRESAIARVREMNTPLLTMQGESDENTPLHFGQEFYNALRFNKKPVIFLSYPGEGHNLTRLENQVDFLQRMENFYGHYLKGEPAADWITKGERFLDKGKRKGTTLRPDGDR